LTGPPPRHRPHENHREHPPATGHRPAGTRPPVKERTAQMNAYAVEQIARQRTAEVRAQAAQDQPAAENRLASRRGPSGRNLTGWALIQIGLALVTSSARHQHTAATSPDLP